MKECDWDGEQEKCSKFCPKTHDKWECLYYRKPGSLADYGVCDGEFPSTAAAATTNATVKDKGKDGK